MSPAFSKPTKNLLDSAEHLWVSEDLLTHERGQVPRAERELVVYMQRDILSHLRNCWLSYR